MAAERRGGRRDGCRDGGRDKSIEYNMICHLGTIAEYKTGWRKELNIIEWNNGAPKFDLRDWDPQHEHMSRGITLIKEEARNLMKLLSEHIEDEEARVVPETSSRMIVADSEGSCREEIAEEIPFEPNASSNRENFEGGSSLDEGSKGELTEDVSVEAF